GPAGPRRGGDHVRRERVGVPGRARRRARPRRGPAARARPGGLRVPGERVAGADARDREPGAAGRGSRRLRAVGARDRGGRPARPRGGAPRGVWRRHRRPRAPPGPPGRCAARAGPVAPPRGGGPADVEDAIGDDPTFATVTTPPDEAFLAVLGSPNVASKRWVWEQYDSIGQGGTVLPPGADAALVRIEGTLRALALST